MSSKEKVDGACADKTAEMQENANMDIDGEPQQQPENIISQDEPTEVQELAVPENASASSPYLGTQEALVADLSSQEDAHFAEGATQTSPRWEDLIKENKIEENDIASQQLLSPEKEEEMAKNEFNSQQVDSPGDAEVINNNIMKGSSEKIGGQDTSMSLGTTADHFFRVGGN
ncbi:hypothetical protein C2845_PM10G15900 [Panicum miliaceum]|uniref:Uncharacterized protein n=1 Tax=Panicum miliaceum TaxID=4540 RepID=A0A3L6PHY9_PANMI|nr:hypothetical protein C2845_PM10G15900 [Panicum miliaceum]